MGAFAQGGFLGQVADQRMRAVSIPWGEYSETISQLDETELADLKDLAMKRPELVENVLDRLQTNQQKVLGEMADTQKLRETVLARQAKARQARRELNYKYAKMRQTARTAKEKQAAYEWFKNEDLRIDDYNSQTSRMNAETSQTNAVTSQGRLTVSQQNAQTSATAAANKAKGFKPIGEVMASLERSQPDTMQLTIATPKNIKAQKAKLVERLMISYGMSVPPGQRALLRKMIQRWVANLRVVKKASTGGGLFGAVGGPVGPAANAK
jgi:hypothetical protein